MNFARSVLKNKKLLLGGVVVAGLSGTAYIVNKRQTSTWDFLKPKPKTNFPVMQSIGNDYTAFVNNSVIECSILLKQSPVPWDVIFTRHYLGLTENDILKHKTDIDNHLTETTKKICDNQYSSCYFTSWRRCGYLDMDVINSYPKDKLPEYIKPDELKMRCSLKNNYKEWLDSRMCFYHLGW
jgi:hypothetical protein